VHQHLMVLAQAFVILCASVIPNDYAEFFFSWL